jgi:hypothetical protein
LIRKASNDAWLTRELRGSRWNAVRKEVKREFIINTYRVLLSRAREGLVIYVPTGNSED